MYRGKVHAKLSCKFRGRWLEGKCGLDVWVGWKVARLCQRWRCIKSPDRSTTRGRSLTFSIQQDSTSTKYDIDQFRGTHLQTRQVRRWTSRWVGLAPAPVQVALPFLWATVLLMFARNWRSQCAKTCDCHSAPWPMGGMNGTVTIRLVEEQREGGVAPNTPTHRMCAYWMTHKCTLISTGTYIFTDEDTCRHRTDQCNAVNTI